LGAEKTVEILVVVLVAALAVTTWLLYVLAAQLQVKK